MKKIVNHPSLIKAADIEQLCKPLAKLDIHYFAHVNIDAQNQFSAIGTEPEFVKCYFEKKYYHYDIHLADLLTKQKYILWDGMNIQGKTREMEDYFNSLGLGHTFTIIRKTSEELNCYHFAAKVNATTMSERYLQNRDALENFINYFLNNVNSDKTLRSAYNKKFKIDSNDAAGFCIESSDLEQQIESCQMHQNRIYIGPNTYLTHREFETLKVLSQGKSPEETAIVLGITLRTVRAHIASMKHKLNAKNLIQLGMIYHQITN